MKRRSFINSCAIGLAASPLTVACSEAASKERIPGCNFDVVIAGGGPSGCAAALAASRMGAKVALIEQHPCFGGVWTMGTLSIIIDGHNKPGIMKEIKTKLRKDEHLHDFYNDPDKKVYNVEAMKKLLDDVLGDSDAYLRLHTFAAKANRSDRQLNSVTTVSKSGFEEWNAKIFIDCTGDGDISALAGCEYEIGNEEDGSTQPGTTYGLVGGWEGEFPKREEMLEIFERAGKDIPYQGMYIFTQDGMHNMGYLMPSHIYDLDATDAESITHSEIEGRRQVHYVVDVLKKYGGPKFRNFFLATTAPTIGVREGRRIIGNYYLTIGDLENGNKFPDSICDVEMPVDIHHVKKEIGTGLDNIWTKPYQIPYRSIVPRGVDNLLTAGRCISGSFLAHGSYRVTGNSVPLGEAAGVAAALALEKDITPSQLDGEIVRAELDKFRSSVQL